MEQPVYKVWMMKYTDAWYKLTQEEKQAFEAKNAEALKSVGGELVMVRMCVWASDEWLGWGVEKFPNMEAAQAYAMALFALNHYQYIQSTSYLGIEMPPM